MPVAFDSLKKDKLIEVFMKYNIDPYIIKSITKLYKDDKTMAKFAKTIKFA